MVWLSADAETVWQRMQADAATRERRPNLATGGLDDTVERQGRLDLVREIADLASSLDYKAGIGRIAELVVRDLGDWCVVDLAEEGAPLKRVAVGLVHRRPPVVPSANVQSL